MIVATLGTAYTLGEVEPDESGPFNALQWCPLPGVWGRHDKFSMDANSFKKPEMRI